MICNTSLPSPLNSDSICSQTLKVQLVFTSKIELSFTIVYKFYKTLTFIANKGSKYFFQYTMLNFKPQMSCKQEIKNCNKTFDPFY